MKYDLENVPTEAPYARDKLQFAYNYIEALLGHIENMKKELREKFKAGRQMVAIKELLGNDKS